MKRSEFMRTAKAVAEAVQGQKPRRQAQYIAFAVQHAAARGIYALKPGADPAHDPVIQTVVVLAGAWVEDIVPVFRDKNPTLTWNHYVILEEAWEAFDANQTVQENETQVHGHRLL